MLLESKWQDCLEEVDDVGFGLNVMIYGGNLFVNYKFLIYYQKF